MTTLMAPGHDQQRLLSDAINERRATPSFDGSPVSDDALSLIVRAGIEAPSGYNLQPWRFVVVREAEQKRRLRDAAMGQAKVEEAGAVIVCCGDLNAPHGRNLEDVLVEAGQHGFTQEQNQKMRETLSSVFGGPAGNMMGLAPDYAVWINRHVMIAFTTMMWMAEVLGYDTAPMEGFFEDQVKSVLNIPEGVRVVALLAIGRRTGPDKPYAGRHRIASVCFAERWGGRINL